MHYYTVTNWNTLNYNVYIYMYLCVYVYVYIFISKTFYERHKLK